MMGFMWLLGLVSTAWANDIVVESDPFSKRADALAVFESIQTQLGDDATERPRLVRRYHQGQGWRYVILIEDVSADRARYIADLAQEFHVIGDTRSAPPADEPSTAAPPATPIATAAPTTAGRGRDSRAERLPEADTLLRAAVRAHGGEDGGGSLLKAAETVSFSYERTIPIQEGELVAWNRFFRSGEALRLEVLIREGEGVDSTTVLTSERQGYVQVGQSVTERDGIRTLEMLERFSPEAILSIPMGLPEDVATATAWRDLETIRRDVRPDVSGTNSEVWVLAGTVDEDGVGLREAAFDVEARRLAWVTWGAVDGDITFTYMDYRALGEDEALIVPFVTRVEREGVLVEEIRVDGLELGTALDAQMFAGRTGD